MVETVEARVHLPQTITTISQTNSQYALFVSKKSKDGQDWRFAKTFQAFLTLEGAVVSVKR